MKEIIISKNENSAYMVLLLEDGKIVEKYDESESNKILEGNIYCGIVKNVLPGMQSAFVDIGEDKNAVLEKEGSIGTDQLGKYLYVVND